MSILLLHSPQVPIGTTESKRTTVPFLYNLDESVEGLNVVDFPGVDDEDDSIGDLADLLITVAQIILFVVDYRYMIKVEYGSSDIPLICTSTHIIISF